ncbi:hypothetical protein BKA80DRAFT_36945 [Phyllosticta citrichinensis]
MILPASSSLPHCSTRPTNKTLQQTRLAQRHPSQMLDTQEPHHHVRINPMSGRQPASSPTRRRPFLTTYLAKTATPAFCGRRRHSLRSLPTRARAPGVASACIILFPGVCVPVYLNSPPGLSLPLLSSFPCSATRKGSVPLPPPAISQSVPGCAHVPCLLRTRH